MDERELDNAIDAAARTMMAREPGRSLGINVMARVRENASTQPRRLVWMPAVAAVVLCAAIPILLTNRAPSEVVLVLPAAPPVAVGQPAIAMLPPSTETPAPRRNTPVTIAAQAAASAPPLPRDISPIEPIETEPIVLSTIDVPVLEPETAVIDVLNVEPLTIEPLAASND